MEKKTTHARRCDFFSLVKERKKAWFPVVCATSKLTYEFENSKKQNAKTDTKLNLSFFGSLKYDTIKNQRLHKRKKTHFT